MERILVGSLLALLAGGAAAQEPAKPANRLAKESSPYLLQHAHNPVQWFPWGAEALEKAKREGKLIFLSIGYSSCHWCHVMERESFEDEEIARLLNEHFVCIKVDREERPDIDAIYMTALQVYNQLINSGRGGGWPLSMFLTPEAEPFVGGTYFPARDGDREGASGFLQLAQKVQQFWAKEPDRIRGDAATVAKFTKAEMEKPRAALTIPLDRKLLAATTEALAEEYDPKYGGFGYSPDGRRPKFPVPSNLLFLLARSASDKDEGAKEMLIATLEKMSLGGIRDHLGGGFHRYSVDRYWRIPHFEKMLYDNGQLASLYALAYEQTGREDFAQVSREICDFVLRELTDREGGFYAALDADSEGVEGKFYRWERGEVDALLGKDDSPLFADLYGLARGPNFEEHFYVPQLSQTIAASAAAQKMTATDFERRLAPLRAKLLAARNQRPRPRTDTKVLTAECGLMIGGLADAGRILSEPRYIAAAKRAADFVLERLRSEDGRLSRSYAEGRSHLNAYLNDYAFLVDGLLRLHTATQEPRWLTAAGELTDKQIELFYDRLNHGFFFTAKDHETLLARGKEVVDGAQPAGNSVAAHNLITLAKLQGRKDYRTLAEQTISMSVALTQANPAAAPRMRLALAEFLKEP